MSDYNILIFNDEKEMKVTWEIGKMLLEDD